MADIRINALATTAASTASDDFIAVDGSANGTRKLNAYSPTFGGNLTVSGTASVTGQINGSAGYQFRAASGTTYELLRYVGGANNPGIFTTVNESTKKVTIFASGSLVSGQTLGLGAEGSEALTLGAANATLAGNLTVSGRDLTLGSSESVIYFGTPSANYLYYSGSSLFLRVGSVDRITIPASTGNVLIGTTTDGGQKLQVSGTAAISGAISIGNTVQTAAAVASTHKVTISIGGSTYYLLATNV